MFKQNITRMLMMVFFISFFSNPALSNNELDSGLQRVEQDISQTKESLEQNKLYLNQLQTQLKKQELSISVVTTELNQLNQKKIQTNREIANINKEQLKLEEQRKAQQESLAKLVQQQYQLSQHNQLTNLLSDQPTEVIDRLFVYAEMISNKKLELVRKINATNAQLNANNQELQIQQAEQKKRYDLQTEERSRLQAEQAQRTETILAINRELKLDQNYLKELESNSVALTRQLKELNEARASVKQPNQIEAQTRNGQKTIVLKGLSKQKGKLKWPASGRILHSYGSQQTEGLKWKGLVIGGNSNSPVRVVSAGKVVFSDWLRGYGLLIIIDHGDDYLTLYGYNQALMKKVNDYVSAGDEIATMGNSGGQKTESLYFEIRQKGKTLDPKQWLTTRR